MKNQAKIGDIYASKLPDGRFGIIRVINTSEEMYLIYTLNYIASNVPNITDLKIGEILERKRFSFNGEKAIQWVEGNVPEQLIYIGNIPLVESEKIIECSVYSGEWGPWCANDIFLEWRWENDRENFEAELREEEDFLTEENINSVGMMDDKTFWKFISKLDMKLDDEDDITKGITMELSKYEEKEIFSFLETLSYKLYLLDTKEHARNIGEYSYKDGQNLHFSEDLFLYIRCYVIAKGKKLYEKVLKNPVNMPHNEFEALLSVAEDAYYLKTKKKFDYVTKYDYETFSNEEGWK